MTARVPPSVKVSSTSSQGRVGSTTPVKRGWNTNRGKRASFERPTRAACLTVWFVKPVVAALTLSARANGMAFRVLFRLPAS